MTYRPILPVEECEARLHRIFPRSAFASRFSSPIAAHALAAMLYVDAILPDDGSVKGEAYWARPSTVMWMTDEILEHDSRSERTAFRDAASRTQRAVKELVASWGMTTYQQWYAADTREPLRDETWKKAWHEVGAMWRRPSSSTTAPSGNWALKASFADLFWPDLEEDDLGVRIDAWREANLNEDARRRVIFHERLGAQTHGVEVRLPDGQVRHLEPGTASQIIKGVVEQWAPARLRAPHVLTISEPGNKFPFADRNLMDRLGIEVDINGLLPDLLMVDVEPGRPIMYWVIEVVATSGAVTDARKATLLEWAQDQHINPGRCKFMTAFTSRSSTPARSHLKELAVDSFAWFADEPTRELSWRTITHPSDNVLKFRD